MDSVQGSGVRVAFMMVAVAGLAGVGLGGAPASAAEVTCLGQAATIVATADNQKLEGTEGPDVISTAGHKGVSIDAGGGDDRVCVPPDDSKFPVTFAHVVQAGTGDDVLDIDSDGTSVYPGPGDDTIHVPPLGDARKPEVTVRFDPAVAGVTIDVPAGTVDGEGHDQFTGTPFFVGTSGGPDHFIGGPGRDFFGSTAYPVPYDGDQPADVIHGYGGDDVIDGFQAEVFGGHGDDHLWGYDNDVHGGPGKDHISAWQGGQADGGTGADTIDALFDLDEPPAISIDDLAVEGGRGDDHLYLPTAENGGYLDCTTCGSKLDGGPGADVLDLRRTNGHMRVDFARAIAHYDDWVIPVAHLEDVEGSARADVLLGNAQANHLDGRGGSDRLVGRGGSDVLNGGKGHDIADGGLGNDQCTAEVRHAC